MTLQVNIEEGGQSKTSSGWLYPGTVPRRAAEPAQESSTAHSSSALQDQQGFQVFERHGRQPAQQPSSRDQYNQFTGAHGHDTYPGFSDGACNYNAQWGLDGEPFWQFQLRAAASRVRHAAGEAAKPCARHLGNQERKLLSRVVAPAMISRFKDTSHVFDALDERVERLIPIANGLPWEERMQVVEDICHNLDQSRKACGHFAKAMPAHPIPPGVAQAHDVMDMLNRVGVDTAGNLHTSHGTYGGQ